VRRAGVARWKSTPSSRAAEQVTRPMARGDAESLGAAQISQGSQAGQDMVVSSPARVGVGRGWEPLWELRASKKFEGTSAIVFEPWRFRPGSTATRVIGAGPSRRHGRFLISKLLVIYRRGNPVYIKNEVESFSCAIRVYLEANHMAAASDQGQS
jgi:hypothetical protein